MARKGVKNPILGNGRGNFQDHLSICKHKMYWKFPTPFKYLQTQNVLEISNFQYLQAQMVLEISTTVFESKDRGKMVWKFPRQFLNPKTEAKWCENFHDSF